MKTIALLTVALTLLGGPAMAGLFRTSIDLADLAPVDPDRLATLQPTEFEVFRAQVALSAAKAAESRAEGELKAADRFVDAERLDLKAARAEAKAAKANADTQRAAAAAATTTGAEQDLETARKLHAWKGQERDARRAEIARAKSAVDLAEARRDLARVRLLAEVDAAAAEKYDLRDLEKTVTKRERALEDASKKSAERAEKIAPLRSAYEAVARQTPFNVGEE